MRLDPSARFIGIDLAWSPRNPSGLAALAPGPRGLRVLACERATDDDAIVAFVARHLGRGTVIAVDAPLRVPNATGRRPCEALLQARFGRHEAGAHPANRTLLARGGVVRGEALVARLGALGVREGTLDGAGRGHLVLECYPHPAQVVLFGLPRTLKYKKKRQPWPAARRELGRLLALLGTLRRPALRLDAALRGALDPAGLAGTRYKSVEDRVDALVCAYVAALAPLGRLEMLGTVAEGHVVVPVALPAPRARG